MPRHLAAHLAAAAVLLFAPDGLAQAVAADSSNPGAGARVRVTTTSNERFTGRIVSQRTDSLVLASDSSATIRTLALGEVARLETSRGMRTRKLRNGAIGFFTGLGAGALMGAAIAEEPQRNCTPGEGFCGAFAGLDQVVGAIVLGVLGGVAGGGIGVYLGSRERESWSTVRGRGGDVRVSVAPTGGSAIRVTASLRF